MTVMTGAHRYTKTRVSYGYCRYRGPHLLEIPIYAEGPINAREDFKLFLRCVKTGVLLDSTYLGYDHGDSGCIKLLELESQCGDIVTENG